MADNFTIFPAIDLRAGNVVRLVQGDPGRQTAYGGNPRTWAERWKSEGANWLHVINLDGAFGEDTRLNMLALESILKAGLKVELGGGIRTQAMIKNVFGMGVNRVFLGTAAIQDSTLVDWAIANYGPTRISGDIGARDGKVVIKGWQETTSLTVCEAGHRLLIHGITRCVLTDVKRDGINKGIEISSATALKAATGLKVVASGGVASIEDILRIRNSGLDGVIVGRALYEGKLSMRDILASIE